MHNPAGFADHCLELLKNRGTTGPTGPTFHNSLNQNEKTGTTDAQDVGPVDFEWSHLVAASGTYKVESNQPLAKAVTSGTSGTTTFAGAVDTGVADDFPSEWSAIFAELSASNPPDDWSHDRWREIISDTGNFLKTWGAAAHQLEWTALDLFGVHPSKPPIRFDLMGLTMLIRGGAVVALTDATATIRRESGAVLTYRRSDKTGAVCLSTLSPHGPR